MPLLYCWQTASEKKDNGWSLITRHKLPARLHWRPFVKSLVDNQPVDANLIAADPDHDILLRLSIACRAHPVY